MFLLWHRCEEPLKHLYFKSVRKYFTFMKNFPITLIPIKIILFHVRKFAENLPNSKREHTLRGPQRVGYLLLYLFISFLTINSIKIQHVSAKSM